MAERGARPRVPALQRRALGAVRALFTPLLPDDYLELINPLWSTQELRGRIERVQRETDAAVTVFIKPGWEWPGHEPGQYLRIGFVVDGVHRWRAYSLTSDPGRPDGLISITPKLVEEGVVTPWLVRRAQPGTVVRLSDVEGTFTLPDPLPDRLLFISAGSGVTPIMSMLRDLDRRDALGDVVHLHSARTPGDVIFGEQLRAMARRCPGFRLHEQMTGADGRIGPDRLDDLCPDWREREAFLSGPAEMLDAMTEHWEREGAGERLHLERFQPIIGQGDGELGEGGTIRFTASDVEATSDGTQPILVAGEEAGATLPYGCRMGICHTCVGTLCAGRIRDLRTGEVSGSVGETVCTCVNAPEGPIEIALWDTDDHAGARMPSMIESPLARLSDEQIDELRREFDAIHDEVFAELGDRDRRYIVSMIEMHRRLVVLGRVLLLGSRRRPAWLAGTALLSMAKILENMEIGHNVMHGQWDWMNDPQISSSTWDWDSASTAEAWKHSHNYVHHTFTNIRGKDRDLGYEIMRIDPHQQWHPIYLLQPFYNLVLAAFFEWGVASHDLDFEAIRKGEKSKEQLRREVKGMLRKGRQQIVKDYLAWPLISALANAAVHAGLAAARRPSLRQRGARRLRRRPEPSRPVLELAIESFRSTLAAAFTANVMRNVWAYAIIFCGHFPDQTYTFSQDEVKDESRGGFYVGQLLGAANIDGSALFHVASGNLGYQVEHHLYPDMPSTRYAEIAPRVKAICERYELPYNTGPFLRQLGGVQRTILRLALPGGTPRPKPGPFRGERDGDDASAQAAMPSSARTSSSATAA